MIELPATILLDLDGAVLREGDGVLRSLKSEGHLLVAAGVSAPVDFSSPDPAYYAEALAYLGWPEGPVVMVGSGAGGGVRAARTLGLATYQVAPGAAGNSPETADRRHGSGSLADFPGWLQLHTPGELDPDYRSLEGALAVLKSTPAALQRLAGEKGPEAWNRRLEESWTPIETIAHLKDVEVEVNRKRVESFLTAEMPFIAGVDTDRWYDNGFGDLPPVGEILAAFTESRMKTLEILDEIPQPGWVMPARHSILGPTNLVEIAGIMAGHDRSHVREIVNALASGTSG